MAPYYKMPGFTLANANLSTRVLLTLFLFSTLCGLGVALLQYSERAGFSGGDTAEWMLGNEGDLDATEIKVEKSYRELLSITHEHALMLPMLLFVLLHLVALCGIGEGWKITLYLTSFLSLGGCFAGMWLTACRGDSWGFVIRGSGLGLTATLFGSCLLPLYELWLRKPLYRKLQRREPPAADPRFPSGSSCPVRGER